MMKWGELDSSDPVWSWPPLPPWTSPPSWWMILMMMMMMMRVAVVTVAVVASWVAVAPLPGVKGGEG